MKNHYFENLGLSVSNWQKKLLLMFCFVVFGIGTSQAQIGVTVTNPSNTTPALAASYTSFAAALTDVNLVTAMTGPITLTLGAGSENAPATGLILGSATLNPVLSATNTITIMGAGAATVINAGVGTATPSSAVPDGMLKLIGADYVTIDGLNFTDGNATNPATMELGLAMFKLSATDGCQNNTVQNCIFNMQRINNAASTAPMVEGSVAIAMMNSTAIASTTVLTVTAASGSNSNNKFYNNTITGGNYGMALIGFAAATPFTLADTNNEVGALGLGNSILNFGGGATTSPSAGIRTLAQYGLNVSYNTVNNNNGSGVNHATTLRGIFINTATSANATINNNSITLQSGATTSLLEGIDNASGSTAASNTININNNIIRFAYATATTGIVNGILNSATPTTLNVNSNSIESIAAGVLAGTGTWVMIETGSPVNAFTNNNSIANITRTGASGTLRGIKTTSPTNWTSNGNTIENISYSAVTSTGSTDGIYSLTSAVNVTANNNIVRNLSTPTSGTINGIREFGVAGTKVFQNNQVYNFFTTAGGAGGATFNGISLSTGDNSVSNNLIYSLNSTGTTGGTGGSATGIRISGGTTNQVLKNKIYDLSSTSTNPIVSGILISGGTTTTTSNNVIGDLRATAANAANPLIGINITGGTTVNAYNNTVLLNTTSTGALFGSSAVSASTTPTVTLRNNIFVNISTANGAGLAVAHRRSTTTLTSYAAASNNNLLYASNIFNDGTNTDATLGAYKTRVASRDASSVTENPTFVSTTGANATFLHIDTTVATQTESGGAPIATVTDDFDGDVRNATTPDIGADEFAGIPLDINGPSIAYTAVGNDCTGGTRTISATFTDASGVPTVGAGLPVAYWRINAGAYTATTGVSMGAGVYNFSIGTGSVVGDVITYYFVAQDTAGTPNTSALPAAGATGFTINPPAVATAPTTPFTYSVITPLNGIYTVGAGGNYTTLTAAVADYNTKCMTGPVTFSLTDATYPSETFPITINQNADASAVNTLTIKPAVGISPIISGSNASAIFLLNAADYVTIDGSNGTTANTICPLSSATRDLTVTNTNAGTSSAVIWLATNVANGATNNKVINTNVVGNSNTTTLVALGSGSATISMSSLGTSNNNNSFVNNAISKTQFGIYSQGASAGNKNLGTVINQNTMNTTAPNNVAKGGIIVGFENNITIAGNTISEIAQTTSPDVFGISLGVQVISTSTFTGNEVTNATVSKNTVGNIRNTGTFSAIGICVAPATSGTNTITNNMISGVSANGTSGDFSGGIFVGGGAGSTTQIYHNTVTMVGTQTGGSDKSYAIAIAGSDPIVDVRNNILINTQNNGSGNNYAVAYGYATFANLTSSYNDYVVGTGATFFIGATGSISAPTNQLDIAALQTATGKDSNAQNITPAFTSAIDLHITDGALDNLGTPIATVIDDINCETRTSTPDMGADEFTFLSVNQFSEVLGFKAYPNPVNNILTIEYTSDVTSVAVYNLLGQQVLAKKVTATTTQVNMSELNAGTYLVKVEAGAVSKTLKIVKK